DENGNGAKIIRKPAFVIEAGTERGGKEVFPELGNDAAAQIDAAASAQGHRQVACRRAEYGAEDIQGLATDGILVGNGHQADVGGAERFGLPALLAAQALVDELQ